MEEFQELLSFDVRKCIVCGGVPQNHEPQYCSDCMATPLRRGCSIKDLKTGTGIKINWFLFSDMKSAEQYAFFWLGPKYFIGWPTFRNRRNGQVLVTQIVGIAD